MNEEYIDYQWQSGNLHIEERHGKYSQDANRETTIQLNDGTVLITQSDERGLSSVVLPLGAIDQFFSKYEEGEIENDA